MKHKSRCDCPTCKKFWDVFDKDEYIIVQAGPIWEISTDIVNHFNYKLDEDGRPRGAPSFVIAKGFHHSGIKQKFIEGTGGIFKRPVFRDYRFIPLHHPCIYIAKRKGKTKNWKILSQFYPKGDVF